MRQAVSLCIQRHGIATFVFVEEELGILGWPHWKRRSAPVDALQELESIRSISTKLETVLHIAAGSPFCTLFDIEQSVMDFIWNERRSGSSGVAHSEQGLHRFADLRLGSMLRHPLLQQLLSRGNIRLHRVLAEAGRVPTVTSTQIFETIFDAVVSRQQQSMAPSSSASSGQKAAGAERFEVELSKAATILVPKIQDILGLVSGLDPDASMLGIFMNSSNAGSFVLSMMNRIHRIQLHLERDVLFKKRGLERVLDQLTSSATPTLTTESDLATGSRLYRTLTLRIPSWTSGTPSVVATKIAALLKSSAAPIFAEHHIPPKAAKELGGFLSAFLLQVVAPLFCHLARTGLQHSPIRV